MTNAARNTASIFTVLGFVLGFIRAPEVRAAECRIWDTQTTVLYSDIPSGPSCVRYWSRSCDGLTWMSWTGIGCSATRIDHKPATCCKDGETYACRVRCEQRLECPPAYHYDHRCKMTTRCEEPATCHAR